MSNLGNIHSIETFGAFDGPGVRYVLFLQGCPFKCQFCHNRDTWDTSVNTIKSVEEIYYDFRKYRSFYQKGGITVSGGEPLLQIDFLIQLFKYFKSHGIHTAIDTAGSTFNELYKPRFDELMQYTDLVMLSIKHMDENIHKKLVGGSNKQVLAFAKYLSDIQKPVYIRHLLLPTITDTHENLTALKEFLFTLSNIEKIEVLPYHKKGIVKWERLSLSYELKDIPEPSSEDVKKVSVFLNEAINR